MEKIKSTLEVYGSNPVWKVRGKNTLSTWKTIITTLAILAISLYLSWTDISNIWIDIKQLPLQQGTVPADSMVVDPFIIGIDFNSAYDFSNFLVQFNTSQLIPQTTCPNDLKNITSTYITCFLASRPTDLMKQTIQLFAFADTSKSFKVYIQTYSFYNVINNLPNPYYVYTVMGRTYCTSRRIRGCPMKTALQFGKQRLNIYNSLNKYSDPITTSGLVFASFITPAAFTYPNLLYGVVIQHNEYTQQSDLISATRQDITTIISAFIGWIQTFTGILAIFFILMNTSNMKLEVAKEVFANKYIQQTKVSFLFSIKIYIIQILDSLCLLKFFIKRGFLLKEYCCQRAFDEIDQSLSVENIFKSIDYIKKTKIKQKQQGIVEFQKQNQNENNNDIQNEFSYQFQTEVDALNKPSTLNRNKKHQVMLISRTQPQSFLKIFKKFDYNPNNIEFDANAKEKSSFLSIFTFYIGLGFIVFVLFKINALSYQTTQQIYTSIQQQIQYTIDPKDQIFYFQFRQYDRALDPITNDPMSDSSGKPIYSDLIHFHPSKFNMTYNFNLVDDSGNILSQYLFDENCPASRDPLLMTNITYFYCVNTPIKISYKKGTRARLNFTFTYTIPSDYNLYSIQLYYTRNYIVNNGVNHDISTIIAGLSNNNQGVAPSYPCEYFATTIQSNSQGYDKIYLKIASAQTYFANYSIPIIPYNQRAFIFAIDNRIEHQFFTFQSILNVFQNVYGINFIFFILISTYIAIPYNKKLAASQVSKKYCSDLQKAKQKEDQIFDIGNLMLYTSSQLAKTLPRENPQYKNMLKID